MKPTLAKQKSKVKFFIVEGNSMLPIIEPKKTIHVVKSDAYKKGDVVVFKLKRRYVVHRIVKITHNKLITKGDHTSGPDPTIRKTNIVGKLYKVGRQRFDTKYWEFINPIIADISLLEYKLALTNNKTFLNTYKKLQNIKTRLIGEKSLHIYYFIHSLANSPFLIGQSILNVLKKTMKTFK